MVGADVDRERLDEPRGEAGRPGNDVAAEPDRRRADGGDEEPERPAATREERGGDRDADRVDEGARETAVLARVLRVGDRAERGPDGGAERPVARFGVAAHSSAAACWSGSPWTAR